MNDFSVAPPVILDCDTSGAESLFTELAALTGRSPVAVMRLRAPALARTMASYTMPVADVDTGREINLETTTVTGDSKKAQRLGQQAARRDVFRCYQSPAVAYGNILRKKGKGEADGFYKLIRTGKFDEARRVHRAAVGRDLTVIGWDNGAYHESKRGRGGGVPKSTVPVIVDNATELKRYVRVVEKRVGWAKSGWYRAGQSIPGGEGGRVPAWMMQPAPGHGTVREGRNPGIMLSNDVEYSSEIMSNVTFSLALAAFDRALAKEVQAVLSYQIRQELGYT